MKKIIVKLFLIFFLLSFLSYRQAFANSNFSTDYDVTYSILENGKTNVNFDVVLTNKTSQYYASSYSIEVGLNDIENVRASDPDGTITPVIIKNNDETAIELNFNRKAVGINNQLNFNLSFDTKSVARNYGKIWEVNIPGLANQDNFQSFNVYVQTPSTFGPPSYIKPEIAAPSKNSLSFTKEQLGSSGIYIGFGNFQIYKFNLSYHLKNSNLFKVKTEIAIPPSTNYQDIEIEDISPKPLNVIVDKDGNWLAQYTLLPSQKIDIAVNGKAKIFLIPKKEPITKDKISIYTKEQPHWEVSNPNIKKLAGKLKTPQAIYEYVVENLTYDLSRVIERKQRLGAVSVLKDPKSAVCLEFTDLFIALARAAGIPAREIDGFGYTQDSKERPLSLVKDILHAWPEYYDFDREAWIMIDPTWGNTTKGLDYFDTLDFDHFAFAIKGENSTYPIPAGGYKIEGDEALKDVNVNFTEGFVEKNVMLTVTQDFSNSYLAGGPIKGNLIIKNVSANISNPQIMEVSTNFLKPTTQRLFVDQIPPYGFLTIPLNLYKTSILTNVNDEITITVGGKSYFKNLKVSPFFLHKLFLLGGGILSVIIIVLSILVSKTRGLPFFKQKR